MRERNAIQTMLLFTGSKSTSLSESEIETFL
jgi:hypothetical protein